MLALGLLIAVLASCVSDAAPRLQDVYLLDGDASLRVTYVFGTPGPFADPDAAAGLVDLTAPEPDARRSAPGPAPVVPSALDIGGEAYRAAPSDVLAAGFTVERIPLTTDLRVRTTEPYDLLLYFDGSSWLTLVEEARAGLDTRIAPRPRVGRLRGTGELSDPVADAWADALGQRGERLVVGVVDSDDLPERALDGVSEYRRSGIVVQRDLATDAASFQPPPDEVIWEVLARGQQASGVADPGYALITDRAGFASAWSRVHADRLNPPPLPDVSFEREAVVAIYRGERPTGGYGIEIERMTLEDGDVYVDLRLPDPAPGSAVTQAITSPWLMARVLRRGVNVVWFREPEAGRLLAVARSLE